ncbi:LOB domain-containing protein 4 [Hibiscus syriacus]|uniref:LOB domain-containing protein 4 n=1 Tax=Hibiscus syriacus TaxID=106335 RepID=A0A6A2X030_HIBSY|nr:LOB domain-containing protein 4 [Hibiscus syriacus]
MGASSPCGSCKLLRRRRAKDCIFAPYFPSHDPPKFAIVHKVFGARNVSKMLQELAIEQRADAVAYAARGGSDQDTLHSDAARVDSDTPTH